MNRALAALAFATAAGSGTAHAADPDPTIPLYRATYTVEYKGKNLGTAEFAVSYDEPRDVYEFSSRVIAKGLLKLVNPNPVVERSEFRLVNGALQPLRFQYEDGSRKGEDNLDAQFDWERGVVLVAGGGARREIELRPGALDRGSLQVTLMRDVAANGAPNAYWLVDEDSLQRYAYTDNGEHSVATGVGALATRAFVQQREGSSRTTWLWLAPELRFLPVRIEQRRDGEVQTAFTLAAVEGLPR
jgi:hypothetical protein